MINTKKELRFFLDADKFALGCKGTPKLLGDDVWKYQILLRKCEYYKNQGGLKKILFIKGNFKYRKKIIKHLINKL